MDLRSVKWRSRRGMLELDLMLQPFIEKVYPTLGLEDQKLYWLLLEEEDQSLWRWCLGIEKAPNQYEQLITLLQSTRL